MTSLRKAVLFVTGVALIPVAGALAQNTPATSSTPMAGTGHEAMKAEMKRKMEAGGMHHDGMKGGMMQHGQHGGGTMQHGQHGGKANAHGQGNGHGHGHGAHAASGAGSGHAHGTRTEETAYGRPGDAKKISRTVTIRMNDAMRFVPSVVNVRQGETIRFVVRNEGRLKHEMVIGTMDELKAHAEAMKKHPDMEHDDHPQAVHVNPGRRGNIVWQFTKAGEFDFACLIAGHFDAGMVGKIIVQATGK